MNNNIGMNQEGVLLPKELAERAVKQGDIWGWKFQDIPQVVQNCHELSLAIFSGSVIVVLPKGILDVNWLGAYPKVRMTGEPWKQYVERSCLEFMARFNVLMANINLEKELEHLKNEPNHASISLNDFYFELDFKSESCYIEFISKYSK